MNGRSPYRTISICTLVYDRVHYLPPLIERIAAQELSANVRTRIIVVDNHPGALSRQTVEKVRRETPIPVDYAHEPKAGISNARNCAVAMARGAFLAFIDDDEAPGAQWMDALLRTIDEQRADGALGPVNPIFELECPEWVIEGGFHARTEHNDGWITNHEDGRTGNLLVKMEVFRNVRPAFDVRFATGEDQDFFERALKLGYKFYWSNAAVVGEYIPAQRASVSFFLRRAWFRGRVAARRSQRRARDAVKALVGSLVFGALSTGAWLGGKKLWVKTAVRFLAHSGFLKGLLERNPKSEKYVG